MLKKVNLAGVTRELQDFTSARIPIYFFSHVLKLAFARYTLCLKPGAYFKAIPTS
jgi:hypothetical protein